MFAEATTAARKQVTTTEALGCPFTLEVVEGPDKGTHHLIEATHPTRTLIGKSAMCDVRLADIAVSRRHLALVVSGSRLHVRDLGSTNGTIINDVAVREAYLIGGETLRVGETLIQVRRGEAAIGTAISPRNSFGEVLGTSPVMQRLYPLCDRLASSDVATVIEGETGTGKDLLARALHAMGPRADNPFVVFDCTAVAPSRIESELFGHHKGAFADAVNDYVGVFERASGGTLLIDEIGALSLDVQAKLLRVIEQGEVTRVGGQAPIKVDVRVLSATRLDLDRLVQQGRFREDLFHRIAVARVELPPLRERYGDVPLLARKFWQQMAAANTSIPVDILRSWNDQAWPGNVRELRNAVARRVALGDLPTTEATNQADIASQAASVAVHSVGQGGDPIWAILALDLPLGDARQRLIEEFDLRYVRRQLDLHHGNVTRAAAASGVARRHMQRLKARLVKHDKESE